MNFKEKEKDIKEIIDALYNCYLDELCDEQDYLEENVIEPFKEKYYKPFDWAFGATKLVLIFKDLGFVIKIPLTYCNGYELKGAGDCEDSNWNYCEQEAIRFEWMQEEKIDVVFAETRYLTDIHTFPIYIQEYVEPLNKIKVEDVLKYCNHTKVDTDKVLKVYNENDCYNTYKIDLDWEADVLVTYGEKFYNHFLNVIYDYDIQDLRFANIGYIGKKPVIFDYAGFND